jgi:hypothetical protein
MWFSNFLENALVSRVNRAAVGRDHMDCHCGYNDRRSDFQALEIETEARRAGTDSANEPRNKVA